MGRVEMPHGVSLWTCFLAGAVYLLLLHLLLCLPLHPLLFYFPSLFMILLLCFGSLFLNTHVWPDFILLFSEPVYLRCAFY